MVALQQDGKGNFRARKRLPDDVRAEYGKRFGQRLEVKFYAEAKVGLQEAKRRFHDWQNDIATRVANIRAERTGEGISLTRDQARALAGEWYTWFVARHPYGDLKTWEDLRDKVHEAFKSALGESRRDKADPDELWRIDDELRAEVRPCLADIGETAQFLAMKGLTLNNEARPYFSIGSMRTLRLHCAG